MHPLNSLLLLLKQRSLYPLSNRIRLMGLLLPNLFLMHLPRLDLEAFLEWELALGVYLQTLLP
jgi:hypothetical protein